MSYRIDDLGIPDEDPFRNDSLERKPIIEFLAGLIDRAGGPFVLALDAPWGSGKTTLIKMLQAKLKDDGFQCIHFNAWQVDYVTDPLVALVSSIDQIDLGAAGAAGAAATFKGHVKTLRKLTSLVAKRSVIAAAKAVTLGALEFDKEVEAVASELAGGSAGDVVEAFQREKDVLRKFREALDAAIAQLAAASKRPTLVFFIDELDRCRPSFAIELLERVKHLFDVPNLLFVLSIDKQQLEASTAAVYGSTINAAEYLRRFLDLEYGVPLAKTKRFTETLLTRFSLDEVFALRTGSETRYDKQNFIEFFTSLADVFDLSLRARERCMTRLRVVLDQTPASRFLDPVLVSLLIVLRAKRPELFRQLCAGEASPTDVMRFLEGLPGGRALVRERSGVLIEAYLMAADPNEERTSARDAELKAIVEAEATESVKRGRAMQLIEFRRSVPGAMRYGHLRLSHVAAKVDLAAYVQE